MTRIELWCERHAPAISRLYWAIAWLCVFLSFAISNIFGVGAFAFSLGAIAVHYVTPSDGSPTLEEWSPTSTSPVERSSSS